MGNDGRDAGDVPRATDMGPAQQRHVSCLSEIAADEVKALARSLVCFRVQAVAEILGCSIAMVRTLVRRGSLAGFYLGSALRVPAWSLAAYQEGRTASHRADALRFHSRLPASVKRAAAVKAREVRRARLMTQRAEALRQAGVLSPPPNNQETP